MMSDGGAIVELQWASSGTAHSVNNKLHRSMYSVGDVGLAVLQIECLHHLTSDAGVFLEA